MTPPSSHKPHAVEMRIYRHQSRLRLLRAFGGFCSTCGGRGSPENRLEFAHRVPARRARGDDGRAEFRSLDHLLRAVKAHPFLFVVLCRDCHHALDGPSWKGNL